MESPADHTMVKSPDTKIRLAALLCQAVCLGSVDTVKHCLRNSAFDKAEFVDAFGADGWNAAMIATSNGREDILEILFDRGANPHQLDPRSGQSLLMIAVCSNHLSVATSLVKAGVDINYPHADTGITALILAAEKNHQALAQELIECDALINIQTTRHGHTALTKSMLHGDLAMATMLVDKGADIHH